MGWSTISQNWVILRGRKPDILHEPLTIYDFDAVVKEIPELKYSESDVIGSFMYTEVYFSKNLLAQYFKIYSG